VLLFAIGASLLSGLLFGLAPMLRIPVRSVEQALRAGARTIAGRSRRLHSGFVISEIALAVVLLVSAGMLRHTLLALSSLDPGLDPGGVAGRGRSGTARPRWSVTAARVQVTSE